MMRAVGGDYPRFWEGLARIEAELTPHEACMARRFYGGRGILTAERRELRLAIAAATETDPPGDRELVADVRGYLNGRVLAGCCVPAVHAAAAVRLLTGESPGTE
jgi:hypothetical protein